MDFTISEYAEPSSSRRAMSLAFQKARRRFPKNGEASKEDFQNSSDNDASRKSKLSQHLFTENQNYVKSLPEPVESSLIDSLDGMDISNKDEVLYNKCHDDQNDNLFVPVKANILVYNEHGFELDPKQKESVPNDLNDSKNTCPAVIEASVQPSSNYDIQSEYGRTWRTESRYFNHHSSKPLNRKFRNSADFPMTNVVDSDSEQPPPVRILEMPPPRFGKRQRQRRLRPRRGSSSEIGCQEEEEEGIQTPPTRSTCCCYCYCNGQCNHRLPLSCSCCCLCGHCHCHCCFCNANVCCCARRCRSLREFRREQERSPMRCKSSRQRRTRRRRCSLCRRRISTRVRQPDTDSGVFTHTRRGNDAEEEADEDPHALLHKDSLSILQEKYVGARCRRQAADDQETEERRRRRIRRRGPRHM